MMFDKVFVVYSEYADKDKEGRVYRIDQAVQGVYRTLKGARKYVSSQVDHYHGEKVKWREMVDVYYSPNVATSWSTQTFDRHPTSYRISEMEAEE